MTTAHICIMAAIIVYLGAMLFVGYLCSRNNNDSSDFYLGGRKLGPLVTAMSAEASDMSSWLLMGLPGLAYLTGIADAGWTAIGLAIGTYVNWRIVAKKIRRYTHVAGNSITLPSFFSNRYRDGKLFASLFGVKYLPAMIISALVIVGYTTLGGFLAASTTDFIQSIIMSIALVIVFVFGISTAGGIDAVADHARSLPGYLTMFTTEQAYPLLNIISMLAWGLGYFGMPHILLRFMAIEDEEKLTLSRRVATTWVVISLAVAVLIGVVGLGMTAAGEFDLLEGSASETIIVRIADLLSKHGVIAAILAGLILAGILASTMSTADSQLLAASSAVSSDLLGSILKDKETKKESMVADKITLLLIAVVAMFIARDPTSSVFTIVSFAWAGFGAVFGPVVLLALFWRRSNWQGALAGMICGGSMVFIWKYGISKLGGAWGIYELLPAFIVAIAANIIVSLLTKAPSKEITDEFDKVNQK